jgi:SAM-dependent methyltransferase
MQPSPSSNRSVLDKDGRSPWVGQARLFEELAAMQLEGFDDPFTTPPTEDIQIEGINGIDGLPTSYRLGRELWLPGHGFLYREALSCSRTALNARMRAAVQFLQEELSAWREASVYITEAVTPMFDYLKGRFPLLQGSEFLPGVPLGSVRNGVRCEDLQILTFDDDSFDYILSFDVLEHVPNYRLAIAEMARVLRPGGQLLLTAPIIPESPVSHVRAEVGADGDIKHHLPPEYLGNALGPPSLCFTSFGFDLVEDMRTFGFSEAYLQFYQNRELGYWGSPQPLVIANK